jgi:hypothetical protein
MQIVEYELKRYDVWMAEISMKKGDGDKNRQKLQMMIRKQEQLITSKR